jgi:Flp pilus assembly protein TadB
MSGKLSDSPWFWLLMFGAAGVAALAVIGPKHVRRQERLVRMQAARERVQTAAAKAADGSQPPIEDSVPEAVEQPQVSVRPLMAFLASALFIAALVAGWIQVRSPPAPPGPPPNEVTG